jgi:hypothetical protein
MLEQHLGGETSQTQKNPQREIHRNILREPPFLTDPLVIQRYYWKLCHANPQRNPGKCAEMQNNAKRLDLKVQNNDISDPTHG